MTPIIVLDSSPLGLLFQKLGIPEADACRKWLRRHVDAGARIIVPEIVNYELRRELLRLGKSRSVASLDAFNLAVPGRYLPLDTAAIELAAELWAQARRHGRPTADPLALDVDVILAAQVLSAGFAPVDFVVATSNLSHLSQYVAAEDWAKI